MRDIRRESREGEERRLGLVVEEKKRNVVTDNHHSRSDRTTCRHLFGKKSVDPIIGNRSILMHFWIDLIEQCTYLLFRCRHVHPYNGMHH